MAGRDLFSGLSPSQKWKVIAIAFVIGAASGEWRKAPDRWTGSDQEDYAAERKEYEDEADTEREALGKEIQEINQYIARFEEYKQHHKQETTEGFKRISKCETCCAALGADVANCREQLKSIR